MAYLVFCSPIHGVFFTGWIKFLYFLFNQYGVHQLINGTHYTVVNIIMYIILILALFIQHLILLIYHLFMR